MPCLQKLTKRLWEGFAPANLQIFSKFVFILLFLNWQMFSTLALAILWRNPPSSTFNSNPNRIIPQKTHNGFGYTANEFLFYVISILFFQIVTVTQPVLLKVFLVVVRCQPENCANAKNVLKVEFVINANPCSGI